MGTWADEGQPGLFSVEDQRDAIRLANNLSQYRRPDRYQWWIVTIRSMSPSSRGDLLKTITPGECTIRKFRWRDRLAIARASTPTKKSLHAAGFVTATMMIPWVLVISTISAVGRLIGRGPRTYLLHAPVMPPPQTPPSGGVREPRNPAPSSPGNSQTLS